jgi:hypothetical protein
MIVDTVLQIFIMWRTKMIFESLNVRLIYPFIIFPLSNYLRDPFPSLPLAEWISRSTTESLLCSLSGLILLLLLVQTSSMGSDLTSSFDRAGGDGVRLSLSVDEPKLPPPFPFGVGLIPSFKLLLLLFGLLLLVLKILLLLLPRSESNFESIIKEI